MSVLVRTARRGRAGPVGVLLAMALLSACAPLTLPRPAPEGCPPGWRTAVFFSSETAPGSQMVFLSEDAELERRPVPVQGISGSPGSQQSRHGEDVWLLSHGNTFKDVGHLLRFNTWSCGIDLVRTQEQGGWPVGVTPTGGVLTAVTVNGVAGVRLYAPDGTVMAKNGIPDVIITAFATDQDRIIALGNEDASGAALILDLDPNTLEIRQRRIVPAFTAVSSAVFRGDNLYYTPPITASGIESFRLGRLNLRTGEEEAILLPADAPYLLADAPDALYVGHTFMNPAFRPWSEYRKVTRLDPDTAAATVLDVGGPLLEIAVDSDELVVLTGEQTVSVTRRDRISGAARATVEVAPPSGGYYYPAGMIVNGGAERT